MYLSKHEKWMKYSLNEAKKALKHHEVPVGAIVVYDKKIIGTGFNQVITFSDPTAHAEIIALRKASKFKKNYRLIGCDLYVTLEPCLMCLGTILETRLNRVFFGSFNKKKIHLSLRNKEFINYYFKKISFIGGILKEETSSIISNFFKPKRH